MTYDRNRVKSRGLKRQEKVKVLRKRDGAGAGLGRKCEVGILRRKVNRRMRQGEEKKTDVTALL